MQCLRLQGYTVVCGVACKDNSKVGGCSNAGVSVVGCDRLVVFVGGIK